MMVGEGFYFTAAGWAHGFEICLLFLAGWYLSITNGMLLAMYRDACPPPRGEAGSMQNAAGASLVTQWRRWVAGHRMRDLLIDEPEWLVLALSVAPAVRQPAVVVVALVGLLLQKALVTVVFWLRRRQCRA
jgi:hypothetical protein